MTSRTGRTGVALAAVLTLAVAGCSSSGPAVVHPPAALSGLPSLPTSAAAAAHTSAAGATSQISVRFVNVYAKGMTAGPALDIYEGQPGQPGTLLVRDLPYGSASSYVHPLLAPNAIDTGEGKPTEPLYAIPTGENPVSQQADTATIDQLADDGSHPQITELLEASTDSISQGPLAGMSISTRLEKGTFNGATTTDTPPAGTTELLADDSDVTDSGVVGGDNAVREAYLLIDTSCAPAANGDPLEPGLPAIFAADGKAPVSTFAVFPVSAGTHQVAVATTDISENLTCQDLTTRQGQTSTTIASGQQVEVYVYGTSKTDLHLLFAPVQS